MHRSGWISVLVLAGCRPTGAVDPVDASATDVDTADAAPRLERVDLRDASEPAPPLDHACEGMKLALIGAVLDEHCAVPSDAWGGLAEAPGLVQEAKLAGDHVVFALTNRGPKTIDVPLRFDDRHPERAFSVVAETDGGLFALAPPTFDVAPADAGVHVHSARIRLPPGGMASVVLTIDLGVAERIDRRDAAAPKRVAPPVTLHVGQLLCPLEAGDPARVLR